MKKKSLSFLPFIIGLAGCGANSTPATSTTLTTTNAMTEIVSTLSTQIDGASGIADYNAFVFQPNSKSSHFRMNAVSFGGDWTSTSMGAFNDPRDNATALSPKDFMGVQLDDSAVRTSDGGAINAFGRMKQAFQIFCALGVAAKVNGVTVDENGYLSNGTMDTTFTASLKLTMTSTCGIDTSNIPDNTTMTATITTGGANYDKVITFDLFDQKYMVKNTATFLRVATAENGSFGYARTAAEYNKSTGVVRAEYVSTPLNGTPTKAIELYRLYFDGTNDEGMIFGYRGNNVADSNATSFIVSGKPNTGDALSLSMKSESVGGFGDATSRNACVLSSTGNIATDGSLCTASSTRLAGADITAIDTPVGNYYTTYADSSPAGQANWGTTGLGDTDLISFTDMTDLVTAAFAP